MDVMICLTKLLASTEAYRSLRMSTSRVKRRDRVDDCTGGPQGRLVMSWTVAKRATMNIMLRLSDDSWKPATTTFRIVQIFAHPKVALVPFVNSLFSAVRILGTRFHAQRLTNL